MTETPTTVPDHETVAPDEPDEPEAVKPPKPRSVRVLWAVAWASWIGLGIVMEIVALAMTQPGDTLSENVWELLELARQAPGGAVLVAGMSMLLIGFFGWVTLHFLQRLTSRNRL